MNHPVLVNIAADIRTLATEHASKIGWERSTDNLLRCLHCVQGCHYSRYPKTRQKFWENVRELLVQHGIDPEPIYKAMEVKLATKDWRTNIPFTQEDLLNWVAEQLNTRPDQL